MKRCYPIELIEEFGNDLDTIFGTPEEQESKKDLRSIAGNTKEYARLVKKLPNGGVLDVYDKFGKKARPSFLEVAIEVLKMLRDSGIFDEYKLPKLGVNFLRLGGELVDWKQLYLRYPVQRNVKVWHILRDILIEWDDNLNDPAYVRVLSDNTMNVNDKQHGNFGRLIMGAEKVFVEGVHSDDQSMDSNMYASRNIHNLESGWENDANVRVTRAQDYEREGRVIKEDDKPYLEFYNLLEDEGCGWQEKGLTKRARICNRGEDLFDHFQTYGEPVFRRCVKINVAMWPHGELSHEFVLGASAFLRQMKDSGFTDSQMRDIAGYVQRAVGDTFPDNPKKQNRATGQGTLWGMVKSFRDSLEQTGVSKDWRVNLTPSYLMAAAIHNLIMNMNAYHKTNSNRTIVKYTLPKIIFKHEDKRHEIDIVAPYFATGYSPKKKGFVANEDDATEFDHTALMFTEE